MSTLGGIKSGWDQVREGCTKFQEDGSISTSTRVNLGIVEFPLEVGEILSFHGR